MNEPAPKAPRARPWRVAWYVLTAISAVAALFVEPALAGAVARGAVGAGWMFLPIGLFSLLFSGYALDRWRLVGRRRYPAGRALLQTLFGVIFASVLLSSAISDWRDARPLGSDRLLGHPDPEIRRAAVYALGFAGASPDRVDRVRGRLDDRAAEVRVAALEVLSRWSGRATGDLAGIQAWASAISRTSTVSPTP
ncbi:MAG: HEAT repeat domain-containing protein [Deltaproteobacteria bacterium]|nr:HEAT repeat domain-containing protein [Deltaproteobacteria bacterium]